MMADGYTRNGGRPRWLAAVAVFLALVVWARSDRAEEAAVPARLQAELLAKVAAYDRNFAARAGSRALVLVAVKDGDAESARSAEAIQKALAGLGPIAGLPHDEALIGFGDASTFARTIRARRAAIAYLPAGFSEGEIAGVARALEGADVLSVGAIASYVPKGAVLGFDLVSGKPKLLVHLGQARRQNVAFGAEILKLMQVYE
jgi:hypothetical protein